MPRLGFILSIASLCLLGLCSSSAQEFSKENLDQTLRSAQMRAKQSAEAAEKSANAAAESEKQARVAEELRKTAEAALAAEKLASRSMRAELQVIRDTAAEQEEWLKEQGRLRQVAEDKLAAAMIELDKKDTHIAALKRIGSSLIAAALTLLCITKPIQAMLPLYWKWLAPILAFPAGYAFGQWIL